jgi:hypothetical protein
MREDRGSILLLMRNPAYVRNFEPILRELAERGWPLTVIFEERKDRGDEGGLALAESLARELPGLRHEVLRPLPLGLRSRLKLGLKAAQDYLRYFEPPYERPGKLRARALAFVPVRMERALCVVLDPLPVVRRALRAIARRADRLLGEEPEIRVELRTRMPAVLVVTPMVHFRSRQNDWVLSAKRLGIPTALCINGWDNFTNKGLVHEQPDLVVVWNEAQAAEAVELHGVPAQSLAITGAWPYQHWLDWRPSRSREAFCSELGLAEDERIILYVCSSRFIAEDERSAVLRWISALRHSRDRALAAANVVIRPHPLNAEQWLEPWPDRPRGVVVFPREGLDPVDEPTRADYFDSLTHADAVVGVNTSALIESAIVGRPAFAFPAPDFRSTQEELPHFRRLVGDEGMVAASIDMDGHLAQLGSTLVNGTGSDVLRRRFIEAFLLPREPGDTPAERVAEAIEGLLGEGSPIRIGT